MAHTVAVIGAFDTKGQEYAFLRRQILENGCQVLTINTGVLGTTDLFPVHVEADELAKAAGDSLFVLRREGDRGAAMQAMGEGAAAVAREMYDQGRFDAIIGMGGTGGSSVVTAAMRVLPLGVPKICVSTAASGETSAYVGTADVVLVPSIVDVAGINRVSRIIFTRAAGAVCGMVAAEPPRPTEQKPVIVASMFGNTTQCVGACEATLTARGYEVLVFHAVGTGGRTMESLVRDGLADGVLDITTTEWADTICGGVFDAGPERLSAAGDMGVPQLIVPGCVDMANFGNMQTVPEKFKDAGRLFYEWNPAVTLMRTNAEENRRMGRVFADKANAAGGPVAFLLPLRGVSILDGDGELFCDREADGALFDTLRAHVCDDIPVYELDYNINDAEFSARAVEILLDLMQQKVVSAK